MKIPKLHRVKCMCTEQYTFCRNKYKQQGTHQNGCLWQEERNESGVQG